MPKTKEQIEQEVKAKAELTANIEEEVVDIQLEIQPEKDGIKIGDLVIGETNKDTFMKTYGVPRGGAVMAIKVYRDGEHIGYIPVYGKIWT